MIDPTTFSKAACAASFLPWIMIDAFLILAVIVGAFIGGFFVYRVQAKRVAYDHITNHELSAEWEELVAEATGYLAQKANKDDWKEIALAWSEKRLAEEGMADTVRPIFEYLNRREVMSIFLLDGTMNQSAYARWWGVTFIKEWQAVKPFVQALRAACGDNGLYCEFETLANSEKFKNEIRKARMKANGSRPDQ